MDSGIYLLLWPNNDFYFGQSAALDRRIKSHLVDLRAGRHGNVRLQRCYDKYGKPDVLFIDLCPPHLLNTYEQHYIGAFFGRDNCCNLSPTAGSCLGIKKDEAFKEKCRCRMRTKNPTKDVGHTAESRLKMSNSHKGKKLTAEHAAKIHAHIQKGNHPKARKVHRPSTGEIWDCINDCVDSTGFSDSHVRKCLNGARPNTIGIFFLT